MDAVIICVPQDYGWAADLAEQLETAGYRAYIEPPEVNAKVRQKTSAAMRDAHAMIAVVTPESALGESAATFEEWWRPFENNKRMIIPVLPVYNPKGAKNWMPYDLYQHHPVDFAEPTAFITLTKRLGKPKITLMATPPTISLPPLPQMEMATPEPIIIDPPAPPPPPSHPESYPDIPDLITEKPQMGFLNYLINIIAGFFLVVIIWGAALQSNTSLLGWLAGIGMVGGALFVLARIELARRQERLWIRRRWQRAQQLGTSTSRPLIYVEIIESPHNDEKQTIWEYYGTELSFGKIAHTTIPLWRYKGLDAEQGVIIYEDGRYILENTGQAQPMMVVGQTLSPQATMVIHNGDLIALPKVGLMLQFRISADAGST